MNSLKITLVAFFLLLFSCPHLLWSGARQPLPVPTRGEDSVDDSPRHVEIIGGKSFALFYRVHPDGKAEKLLKVFTDYPEFKATLIFPPNYFVSEARQALIEEFRILIRNEQIEMALSLDNEPNLPLLGSLKLAEKNMRGQWGILFEWPEDIAAQLARGVGSYQRHWETQPIGFYPPYLFSSQAVLKSLTRFRLKWMMARPQEGIGYLNEEGIKILVPPILVIDEKLIEGTELWSDGLVSEVLKYPFSLVDGSTWEMPKTEVRFLEKMAQKTTWELTGINLIRGEGLVKFLSGPGVTLRTSAPVFEFDYSRWVQSDKQRLAWSALANARKVIQQYQNSGQADLARLDAALEEMVTAESGAFLLALGQSEKPLTMNEKSFLATLANVYRLCGIPAPSNHDNWFELGGRSSGNRSTSKRESPFFVEGVQQLIWNDTSQDDFGDGTYVYPSGDYPPGAFDAKSFSVTWTDAQINFEVEFGSILDPTKNSILPMIDVYVDVNRFAGAGNGTTLNGRGSSAVQKEAAWEYALSFGYLSGALYQAIPGQNPREILELKPTLDKSRQTIKVSVSRDLLRGGPHSWRMSVGVLGFENGKPVPVQAGVSPKAFGGALVGRSAPPYVDLISGSVDDQKQALGAYRRGAQVQLPYFEAE